eukprot:183017_1
MASLFLTVALCILSKATLVKNKWHHDVSYHDNNKMKLKFDTNELNEEWSFLYKEPSKVLSDFTTKEPNDDYEVVYNLIKRVLKSDTLTSQFSLQFITNKIPNKQFENINLGPNARNHPFWSDGYYLDVTELDNDGKNIILRGTSIIALATAFNWYLASICNTTYDWRTYTLDLPSPLPLPSYQKRIRSVPYTYYENVCTVSYTQAFWSWTQWETHLDWMAMNGINFPLAFSGQEYVWAKTYARFNLTTQDLQPFFSGTGFFAWQRMGNIRGWGGPLRESAIMNQYELQLQILARMRSFGMKPALTGFAGHVPYALKKYYPDADVEYSPNWGRFPAEYCCVMLLNFTDPLFIQIGSVFIEEQIKYYGTDHVYQCDSFNEMDPPTNDTTYLHNAGSKIYEAMNNVDPNSIWLMQSWLFNDGEGFWTTTAVADYLGGVPNDGMMILDLAAEMDAQYKYFESFYGKAFVWNTLHSYGGNHGLLGPLGYIAVGIPEALEFPNTTVVGVGITMEGIWQNYIVYDETLSMGYYTQNLSVTDYVRKYVYRRYGLPHTIGEVSKVDSIINSLQSGWNILQNTVYNINHMGVIKNIMVLTPSFTCMKNGFHGTNLLWDPVDIQKVWKVYININDDKLINVTKFRYDLIDITRQCLADLYYIYYSNFTTSWSKKNVSGINYYSNNMLSLLDDIDRVLSTDIHWMLGAWIDLAKNQTTNQSDQDWWVFNAKNQVTLWGPTGQISDYASKNWGGLISTYHKPQWMLFINNVKKQSMNNNYTWDQKQFATDNMNQIQLPWQTNNDNIPDKPVGDTVQIACELYKKWNMFGDATCS